MEKEKITMLGTGAAMVTRCYNTCFTISDGDEYFLVDAGGGNGIFVQLSKAGIPISAIHHAFISHNHSDHLLGMVWMVRAVTQLMNKGEYDGTFTLYGHPTSLEAVQTIARLVMQPKLTAHIGGRVIFHAVADGDVCDVLGRRIQFFDIQSTKMLQYGFVARLHNGRRLAFLGDEPFNEACRGVVEGAEIIMHDALCLDSEKETVQPHAKHHSTALDACRHAASLEAQAVVMYHSHDKHLATRKTAYTQEGATVFGGQIFVPDDLEVIGLD